MTSSMLFQVMSKTGNGLAINKNNPIPGSQLIVSSPHSNDPDQQWTFVFLQQVGASVLFNPGRNFFAAPTGLSKGAAVVLYKMPAGTSWSFSGNNTWNISGRAIRPQANTDLNLNVLGNSWPPGTAVGIYTWDGGAPNEVWDVIPVAG
jgi:hypothetical protein